MRLTSLQAFQAGLQSLLPAVMVLQSAAPDPSGNGQVLNDKCWPAAHCHACIVGGAHVLVAYHCCDCRGGAFKFYFHVSADYPHKPPKVLCQTKVYHPNIDLEGNVCLNVLREEWKPVLNINTIVYGLNHLFVVCSPRYKHCSLAHADSQCA